MLKVRKRIKLILGHQKLFIFDCRANLSFDIFSLLRGKFDLFFFTNQKISELIAQAIEPRKEYLLVKKKDLELPDNLTYQPFDL